MPFKQDQPVNTNSSSHHNAESSAAAKQTSINRNGLYSMNQNELKNELKRIDLCRRQYELSFIHEQRKIITRIANKLIHSNSNLDVIFKGRSTRNTHQNVQNSDTLLDSFQAARNPPPPHPQQPLPLSSTLRPPLTAPNMKRGITYLGFSHNNNTRPLGSAVSDNDTADSRQSSHNDTVTPKSRPITSVPPTTAPSILSDGGDRFPSIQSAVAKKSVKWNPEIESMPSDTLPPSTTTNPTSNHAKSRTSMYELNKKYDELRLKYPDREPKLLLPLLVSSNRRSQTEFLGTKPNSEIVIDENRRKIGEYKRTFLNLVDREDSGFYSYKDAKGQPVCLGYDNYGILLESANSNRSRLMDTPTLNDRASIHYDNMDNRLSAQIDLRQRQLFRQKLKISKPAELVFDPALLEAKYEEENKLCNDTFKAQTIKSLTFKNVTTY